MKKFILLIDSGNDVLEVFEDAMSQEDISPFYDCILVRNSYMAAKVLNRIIPEMIFVNLSADICLQECLSTVYQVKMLYKTPVYFFGNAGVHASSGIK